MNYDALISSIAEAHQHAQTGAAGAINRHLILRNWLIGAWLVEFEQNGEDRAKYGAGLLTRLASDLKHREVPGLGVSMLKDCRIFYRLYPQIRQPAVGELPASAVSLPIGQPPVGELSAGDTSAPAVRKSSARLPVPLSPSILLRLSWTHLLELIRLDDPWKRAFYENDCLKSGWSKRQLQRQIGSLLYERTGLSSDKQAVIEAARKQAIESPARIADLIRDPYVLEFAGLAEKPHYLERDLETALLDHLQAFLLELGTGFCFEARQRRITIGNEHDYLDLVFYHRILRCHLPIDLKIRPFQHADAGQIHPVRYHAKQFLLRLRSSESQRWNALRRVHKRPSSSSGRASGRGCSLHQRQTARRTRLLRGLSFAIRRHQTREVSQNRLGQALHQRPPRRLSHGVNFYLNFWKAEMMAEGDQPPVGLVLCTDKKETRVDYATAGLDHQLFVSRYLVALPKPEELQHLIEEDTAAWHQRHEGNTDENPAP